jgi:outer membrane protein assembly factor BamB
MNMKLRRAVFTLAAAALLISAGAGCQRTIKPPVFVSVPNTVFAGETASLRLVTYVIGYQSTGYVMDWGDTVETDSGRFALGDTATVSHVWSVPGVKQVRARAFPFADPTLLTDWSERETVVVVLGGEHAPVIDTVVFDPPVAVKGVEEFFTVMAHDPDGDSVRLVFDWGAGDTTTAYFASPCTFRFSHVFTQVETAVVIVIAQDTRGATSFPDTVYVPVGYAGGVTWCWPSNREPPRPYVASPVIVNDGTGEFLYGVRKDDYKFYAIRLADGHEVYCASTKFPGSEFTGQLAFCEATQHIIVGSDEGELYALKVDGLGKAWQWPDNPESLMTGLEWGAPAIKDNRLYVPHEDDSLFYFIDSVDHGVRVAAFTPHAGLVDAPVIDAQGNVYFGTDSGYLYKMGPELDTVFWRTRLLTNGEIHGPAIGGDGTVYCASDESRVYAIDPVTGSVKPGWPLTLDGKVTRLALGQMGLFVGTSFGKAYSINPVTGSINWEKQPTLTAGFITTPIVAANGYVYFQDDNDVLYCLNQADGTLIWFCDCPSYLPRSGGNSHRPRKLQLTDYAPNPTILANGNIIVPGSEALYCVAGYPERPLDPLAPWPKWQHDLYNTGHVGGGR